MSEDPKTTEKRYSVRMHRFTWVCIAALVVGCSSSKTTSSTNPPQKEAGPACDPHAVEGEPHFTDQTAAWGLTGITGNRIIAVDLDGDGYPDLIVHSIASGTANQRGTTDSPANMLVHILMNRPRPGGGRMFVDQTVQSGYGTTRDSAPGELRSAQLAVAGDVDNDGDLDLFSGTYTNSAVVQNPPTPADLDRSEILLNDGKGHFTLGPKLSPEDELATPTTGATFADVDRDGKIDLFVVGWYNDYGASYVGTQARLHLGNGDGTFHEVTNTAGLLTDQNDFATGGASRAAYGTTSCDVNGDGAPDLLISAYGREWNQLYLNDGKGNFHDVGRASGYAGDANMTYSDNQYFLCWCTVHQDPACPPNPKPLIECPTPADSGWDSVNDPLPWRNNGNTFTTVCSDITGDGVMDLYSAEIRHWWAGEGSDASELLVGSVGKNGQPSYTRPGNDKTGLVWQHATEDWDEGALMADAADLDNDGRKDIIVAASDYPNQYSLLFHQKPDGSFEEVGQQWGLHHPCASGLAVADFDRDGDLDVVVGSGTARDCGSIWKTNEVHFYENNASQKGGHWLEVHLKGKPPSNAAAIGARVTVTAGGEKQMQEVSGGYGHFGQQNDLVLFFGLGACTSADKIDVRWPDAKLDHTAESATPADQLVTISGPSN
jgi:enediyne biosynthesis protein E4